MGRTNPQALAQWLRAWLVGTVIVLSPLLFLDEIDFLLRRYLISPKIWPDWASLPISMALGIAATVWVGLRRGWEAAPQWEVLAQRVTRHMLFLILSVYAVSKMLRTQFRVPYFILDTPLGDVSGYMLAW